MTHRTSMPMKHALSSPPIAGLIAICLLVALTSPASCAHRQASESEKDSGDPSPGLAVAPFFPLAVDNEWRYTGSHLGQQREQEIRIVGRDGPWFVDSEGEKFMVDAEGLRTPDRYLLRAPLEPGGSWKSTVSLTATESYKIDEVGVTTRVPAGVFHGCTKVTARLRIDTATRLVKTDTFCPGVGLVRIKSFVESEGRGRIPQGELVLEDYELSPGEDEGNES